MKELRFYVKNDIIELQKKDNEEWEYLASFDLQEDKRNNQYCLININLITYINDWLKLGYIFTGTVME